MSTPTRPASITEQQWDYYTKNLTAKQLRDLVTRVETYAATVAEKAAEGAAPQTAEQASVAAWAPIDLTPDASQPAYKGTTGRGAPWPPAYYANTGAWGMRLAPNVIAIDVDHYDHKRGADVMAKLTAELGPLPAAWKVTSRGRDEPGGKFPFRVPVGLDWHDPHEHVQILHNGWRYIAMGTHRKTNTPVMLFSPYGIELDPAAHPLTVTYLPELPAAWVERLSKPLRAAQTGTPDTRPDAEPNPALAPLAPQNGIGSRTANGDYNGGLLGYARDLREAGAGSAVIAERLSEIARDDDPGRPWTDKHFEKLASEAVKTKPVDVIAGLDLSHANGNGHQGAGIPPAAQQTFAQMQAQPHGQAAAPQQPAKRRKRTTAAETDIRPVEYLWEPYVPANMITVLGGMEGSGKTQIVFELVGRVTRSGRPVIILSPEDPREQVTVPRLIAAGADLARCHFYDAEAGEEDVTLRADLTGLGEFAEETGAALVVFDPIVSVLDATTDGDSYSDVSRELGRLTTWADERKVTVLAVTHLRKASDGQALNKMMGSRAFTSKPRSVLMTAVHPEDPEIRLLAHAKSNVGKEGPTLGYTVETELIDRVGRRVAGGPGDHVESSRVKYSGNYEMWSAGALMAAAAKPAGRPPKIVDCAEFIRKYLEERGGAAPVTEVRAAAAAEGYGTDMLRGGELKTLARVTHQQTSGVTPTVHYWSLIADDGRWTVPTAEQVTSWLERA